MGTTVTTAHPTATRKPLPLATAAVGATFLLVGVLGFVPGITSDLGNINFVGHASGAKLLGLFQVNVVHNIVHLLFGVVGLAAARAPRTAKTYLLAGGFVYLLLFAYGLVVGLNTPWNFAAFNTADNWLHLGLGFAMVSLGAALGSRTEGTAPGRTHSPQAR